MSPLVFLVDTLFNIYIVILLLRFLLQQLGADFYNPISQFIVKATQKPVFITRRIIPSLRGVDLATLCLAYLFIIIKILLILLIQSGYPSSIGVTVYSMALTPVFGLFELVTLSISVFIIAVFIQVILSWVNPDPYNPVVGILNSLTNPVLSPARKMMPPTGGIDLSPIVVIIGLTFTKLVIIEIFRLLLAGIL
jgi:YggT family protein